MDFLKGEIMAVDKPYRMSSFGALAHVRYVMSKRLGKKVKIGHAGTLDPLATGVLVLCTGKKTKLIEQLQTHTKEYVATMQLGATTDSYDREHTVNRTYPKEHISLELIRSVLPQFIGDRAYSLRRKGDSVELAPKTVRIDEIEILDFNANEKTLAIRVVCGKGTYIRALARDLGRALGSGAFLTSLRRTRVGDIRVEDCVDFDNVAEWLDKVLTE